jgi:hypothetical protein
MARARRFDRAAAVLRREARGIEDRRALLALANLPARLFRLTKGEPPLRGEATPRRLGPEDQDIDARIAPPRVGIARQARRETGGVPRLRPWETSGLELADDPRRDLVVKRTARRDAARVLAAVCILVTARTQRAVALGRGTVLPRHLAARSRAALHGCGLVQALRESTHGASPPDQIRRGRPRTAGRAANPRTRDRPRRRPRTRRAAAKRRSRATPGLRGRRAVPQAVRRPHRCPRCRPTNTPPRGTRGVTKRRWLI